MNQNDPLFQEEEWYTHPLFSALRMQYQSWRDQAEQVIQLWPEHDAASQAYQATQFYLDAMAPSHIPFLHPKVIQTTLEEGGANLQRGMQQWLRHMQQSAMQQNPFFLPPMVDTSSFMVGSSVAATPGYVVWEHPLFQLIHYTPTQKKVRSIPIVIIPPWINKYYILDLSHNNSFVGWCVDQGVDVYMVSWVNPGDEQADQGLTDYVKAIIAALTKVADITQETPHTVGYCVGGLGLLLGLACEPKKTSGLTLLTTPIDFSQMTPFQAWMSELFIEEIDEASQMSGGIIHGQWFSLLFSLLRPHEMLWKNSIDQYFLGKDAPSLDFLFWNNDPMNVVGKLHAEYLEAFFKQNIFMHPPFPFMGRLRSLKSIACPIFVLNTRRDHIVPFEASMVPSQKIWPHAVCVLADSGHVAGVVNPPSQTKYGYVVGDHHYDGSWWVHWMQWLQPQLGPWQEPRDSSKSMLLEEAPGSYVRVPARPSRPAWNSTNMPFLPLAFSAPSGDKPST